MLVIEHEGSELVKVECERCGYLRWLNNPSTRTMLTLRCNCVVPKKDA